MNLNLPFPDLLKTEFTFMFKEEFISTLTYNQQVQNSVCTLLESPINAIRSTL